MKLKSKHIQFVFFLFLIMIPLIPMGLAQTEIPEFYSDNRYYHDDLNKVWENKIISVDEGEQLHYIIDQKIQTQTGETIFETDRNYVLMEFLNASSEMSGSGEILSLNFGRVEFNRTIQDYDDVSFTDSVEFYALWENSYIAINSDESYMDRDDNFAYMYAPYILPINKHTNYLNISFYEQFIPDYFVTWQKRITAYVGVPDILLIDTDQNRIYSQKTYPDDHGEFPSQTFYLNFTYNDQGILTKGEIKFPYTTYIQTYMRHNVLYQNITLSNRADFFTRFDDIDLLDKNDVKYNVSYSQSSEMSETYFHINNSFPYKDQFRNSIILEGRQYSGIDEILSTRIFETHPDDLQTLILGSYENSKVRSYFEDEHLNEIFSVMPLYYHNFTFLQRPGFTEELLKFLSIHRFGEVEISTDFTESYSYIEVTRPFLESYIFLNVTQENDGWANLEYFHEGDYGRFEFLDFFSLEEASSLPYKINQQIDHTKNTFYAQIMPSFTLEIEESDWQWEFLEFDIFGFPEKSSESNFRPIDQRLRYEFIENDFQVFYPENRFSLLSLNAIPLNITEDIFDFIAIADRLINASQPFYEKSQLSKLQYYDDFSMNLTSEDGTYYLNCTYLPNGLLEKADLHLKYQFSDEITRNYTQNIILTDFETLLKNIKPSFENLTRTYYSVERDHFHSGYLHISQFNYETEYSYQTGTYNFTVLSRFSGYNEQRDRWEEKFEIPIASFEHLQLRLKNYFGINLFFDQSIEEIIEHYQIRYNLPEVSTNHRTFNISNANTNEFINVRLNEKNHLLFAEMFINNSHLILQKTNLNQIEVERGKTIALDSLNPQTMIYNKTIENKTHYVRYHKPNFEGISTTYTYIPEFDIYLRMDSIQHQFLVWNESIRNWYHNNTINPWNLNLGNDTIGIANYRLGKDAFISSKIFSDLTYMEHIPFPLFTLDAEKYLHSLSTMLSYWYDEINIDINTREIIATCSKNDSLYFEIQLNEKNIVTLLHSNIDLFPTIKIELIEERDVPGNVPLEFELHQLEYRVNTTVLIYSKILSGDLPFQVIGIDWGDGNRTINASLYQLHNYRKEGLFNVTVFIQDVNLDLVQMQLEVKSQTFFVPPSPPVDIPEDRPVIVNLLISISTFVGIFSLIIIGYIQITKKRTEQEI